MSIHIILDREGCNQILLIIVIGGHKVVDMLKQIRNSLLIVLLGNDVAETLSTGRHIKVVHQIVGNNHAILLSKVLLIGSGFPLHDIKDVRVILIPILAQKNNRFLFRDTIGHGIICILHIVKDGNFGEFGIGVYNGSDDNRTIILLILHHIFNCDKGRILFLAFRFHFHCILEGYLRDDSHGALFCISDI